jgi:hypothetical protein
MKTNPYCISYWFPKLQSLGVLVPKTIIIEANPKELIQAFDGAKSEELDLLVANIKEPEIS